MRKKLMLLSILISFLFLCFNFANAQEITNIPTNFTSEKDKIWFENNPDSLPIWLTSEELERLDEIGKGFVGSDPPPEPIRQPAEFEPMQGVLIRYPFGISYSIIAEMSEDVEVVTIVASPSEQSYVYSQYQSYGVNLDNCDFLIAPSNSYWTRDYGPWFIFNGNDEQGIVDFIYDRPRPNDNQIPTKFGNAYSIPVYGMSLVHAGGNYMTDGQGISVSTDRVWDENPGYSHIQIDQMVDDYLGINTYHVVPDVNWPTIKHIDCWAKYLAPDTIMIREVPVGHSQYDEIENAVAYFESQMSCYGTSYNVVRVYTPNNEPYTNSLILNDKVLVPIQGSQWDDDAIDSYEAALPGYEILGFTGSWLSTDALHCRAKGIVDRYMLYIGHTPVSGTQSGHEGYDIYAKIITYSGENLITGSTGVYWKIDGGSWDLIEMEPLGNNEYHAVIPPQETGTLVYYYIHAEDYSGRSENHPYIGDPMAYSFTTYFDNNPPETPDIDGPIAGEPGVEYTYCIEAVDPDDDDLYVFWDWDDGETSGWLGPYNSGEIICASHIWDEEGIYIIQVEIKDEFGAIVSASLEVTMPVNQHSYSFPLLQRLLERFPNMFPILRHLIEAQY